jgi:hypothetical protein
MLIVGVDPAQSGALAILSADGSPELLANLPIIRDRSLAWTTDKQLCVATPEGW